MWEYSHEGKQLENKWVFRRLQKTGKVCADVMSGGRLFQSRLPAMAKARSPMVTVTMTIILYIMHVVITCSTLTWLVHDGNFTVTGHNIKIYFWITHLN